VVLSSDTGATFGIKYVINNELVNKVMEVGVNKFK